MSNRMLYDPPLVRALAAELDQRLRGRACAAAPLFLPERVAVLPLDRGEALRLDLHPLRGWIRVVPWPTDSEELDGACVGVEAPADERLLVLRLRATERFRVASRRLVVELHGNQWNVLLVADEDDRILSVLHARTAGERSLRAGSTYVPPRAPGRYGAGAGEAEAWERWRGEVGEAEPERRRGVLLSGFAGLGTTNADAVLGRASLSADPDELRDAFQRWWSLLHGGPARPVLLRDADRIFPYPAPLPGLASEPLASLLEGMDRAAEQEPAPERPSEQAALWEDVLRARAAAQRRRERLEQELASAEDAERFRAWGDLLLANFHRIPRGAGKVELDDWDGQPVTIPLEPALSPSDNAARWYDEARRRQRAADRLPELITAAAQEVERWDAVVEAGPASALPPWAVRALERQPAVRPGGDGAAGPPYRVFRTSGGLEVRVGRSAKENDRLTFGHSSPDDVWLHARSVPGSHVILRWPDASSAPPARDLEEAATLAASHSKARTSAVVPVDWTRRKYVRKPRGAPPGSVVLTRARTLFVEPDPEVENRLRED